MERWKRGGEASHWDIWGRVAGPGLSWEDAWCAEGRGEGRGGEGCGGGVGGPWSPE